MLEKINFKNGVVVSSALLNEVQKATVFNPRIPREDYYNNPTTTIESIWYVGERDGIKDWEIADPALEPQTSLGRLAHDGKILGCLNCDLTSEEQLTLSYGPPRITYRDLFGDPLPIVGENVQSLGIFVNQGTFLNDRGERTSWDTTTVLVELGVNFIYYDIDEEIVVANGVLPNRTRPHIPLAQVEVLPLLLQDEEGNLLENPEASRLIYTDLRPGVFIYADTQIELKNVDDVVVDDYNFNSWERIFADSSNGGFNITLPLNPVDGDKVAIFDLSGTFDTYSVRLYAEGEQTILRDHKTWDLEERFEHTELVFYEPLQMWIFTGQNLGLGSKENLGEFISCGGKECVGVVDADECPDGGNIPAVFPNPSEGRYEYSGGKCYKNLNETIAVYSDGEGGFIKVFNAPRCRRELVNPLPFGEDSKRIYVDANLGDDAIRNTGLSKDSPLRTIERAVLEAVKGRHEYSIELAPGTYYVDNSPGGNIYFRANEDSEYHNLRETGFTVFSYNPQSKVLVIAGDNQDCECIPQGLELGRTIYTSGGAFATIVAAERDRECVGECNWRFTLEGIYGKINSRDTILYNDLSHLNSSSGGLILPKGVSLVSSDLRKTVIRPIFVPSFSQWESFKSIDQNAEPSILKVTSNCYISGIGFGDNKSIKRYHNTLTAVSFAPQREMVDRYEGSDTRGYYYKMSVFLGDREIELRNRDRRDSEIVSSAPFDRALRFQDLQENLTGVSNTDVDGNPTLLKFPGDLSNLETPIPDINSVRSGSPYIQNCSVKSIFGLNGVHANGALVSGFKSILADSFTVVSLQVDPIAYIDEKINYFNDPASGVSKKYKQEMKYRHFAYKASNEAFIQGSSAFVIGAAEHFYAYNGGEISLVGSSSNFGDISLKSQGFYPRAFTQDFSIKTPTSLGTRITELIPPKPLESKLVSRKVRTGYKYLLDPSQIHYDGLTQNNKYRIYLESLDELNPLTVDNPPNVVGLNGFNYTFRNEAGTLLHAGGSDLRDSIYINGLDGQLYRAKPTIFDDPRVEDSAKIFQYDPQPPVDLTSLGTFTKLGSKLISFDALLPQIRTNSYIKILNDIYQVASVYIGSTTTSVTFKEEITQTEEDLEDTIAFLSSNNIVGGRWFIEVENVGINNPNSSAFISQGLESEVAILPSSGSIFLIREIDSRKSVDKIYRVKLEGYLSNLGLRKPQEGYIVSKQFDLDSNEEFINYDNPLVLTNIEKIEDEDGAYFASLVFAEDYQKSKTSSFYPTLNPDAPEQSASIDEDITKKAVYGYDEVLGFKDRGIKIKENQNIILDPQPNETGYKVFSLREDITADVDLRVKLHRPSMIRSTSHMWEWIGYLGYDTSLPKFQGPEFPQDVLLRDKLFSEKAGGRIYASGMDQTGTFYVNNNPIETNKEAQAETIDPQRSLEQESIPQNDVVVNNQLVLNPGSDAVLSEDTSIIFKGATRILGPNRTPVVAQDTLLGIIADESKAGFTQLASALETRAGLITNKVVTPAGLATLTSTTERKGLISLAEVLDEEDFVNAVTPGLLLELNADTQQKGLVILADDLNQGDRVVTSELLSSYLSGEFQSRVNNNVLTGSVLSVTEGSHFIKTVNSNTTFTIANPPPGNFCYKLTLKVIHNAGTISWGSNIYWPGGTPLVLTAGNVHWFTLMSDDEGTTWLGTAFTNYNI